MTQSIAPKTGDRLILRGADGYDEARFARVFNARRPERYPAAVLVAQSEDDVVEGVRLARDRGWKVAIRAGGHSFPAWSLRDDGLLIDLGTFKETAFDALVDPQPTTIAERLEFAGAIHPPGRRYLVDSAWVNGPPRDIIAAAKQLVAERPSGTRGHAFFDFSLPRTEAPDIATSLRTDAMLGSYIIYEGEQNDKAYRAWHLEAMKALEPFTVGQYWGDSDQTVREVKTLTDDAWARLQQIRAKRDPNGLFAGYLAEPGGFRNLNSWETNQ